MKIQEIGQNIKRTRDNVRHAPKKEDTATFPGGREVYFARVSAINDDGTYDVLIATTASFTASNFTLSNCINGTGFNLTYNSVVVVVDRTPERPTIISGQQSLFLAFPHAHAGLMGFLAALGGTGA